MTVEMFFIVFILSVISLSLVVLYLKFTYDNAEVEEVLPIYNT